MGFLLSFNVKTTKFCLRHRGSGKLTGLQSGNLNFLKVRELEGVCREKIGILISSQDFSRKTSLRLFSSQEAMIGGVLCLKQVLLGNNTSQVSSCHWKMTMSKTYFYHSNSKRIIQS